MHTRAKGKSGSTKPLDKTVPSWVTHSASEAQAIIAKLAKAGNSSSQIGIIMRDTYGIPSVKALCGKSVVEIMHEKGFKTRLPEDLTNLMRKSMDIRRHLETNITDKGAKRGLQLTESKIRRLIKYYKNSGVIEQTWNYDPKTISMFIE